MIDWPSDTITRPTPGMIDAMAAAEVGDDVFGDDPSVNRLQDRVAELMGKEAACFVPSGTMANMLSVRSMTEAGDEIIAHEHSHMYMYEAGWAHAACGCGFRFAKGPRGIFDVDQLPSLVRPDDPHFPRSRALAIENTHNVGGGAIWPIEQIERVTKAARTYDLRLHMDGARLWNACVATGLKPSDYARHFDTVSTCFSKALGAPVGSIVSSDAETIRRVRRFRKTFGGAMRQAGYLAAAALYALDHHYDRLADDHANARALAEGLANIDGIDIDLATVETNIVYFNIAKSRGSAEAMCIKLDERKVHMLAVGPQRIRAVTNLHVTAAIIAPAIEAVAKALL